jgi:hypothetical protein
MFQELLGAFRPYRGLSGPPGRPIQLCAEHGRGIWIDGAWGPAVPYPAVDHEDGTRNHGYLRIKGLDHSLLTIPEATDWPELQDLLRAVNTEDSPIESVGCEKGYFTSDIQGAAVKLGSAPSPHGV